jgi:lipoprotein signal peptidase
MRYILPISIALSIIHLYISFFVVERCIVNEGIAFGLSIPYVECVSLLFVVFLFFLSVKTKSNIKYLLFSIASLGSVNVLERFFRGYICDYIRIYNIYLNIMDICITILVVLCILICISWKYGDKDNREE